MTNKTEKCEKCGRDIVTFGDGSTSCPNMGCYI
jgi:hypothetical protein